LGVGLASRLIQLKAVWTAWTELAQRHAGRIPVEWLGYDAWKALLQCKEALRALQDLARPPAAWMTAEGLKQGRGLGETSQWDPVGSQSHLAKLASSQNRVLRGEGRPTLRSVDRECVGRVM